MSSVRYYAISKCSFTRNIDLDFHLYIMRHAESDSPSSDTSDFDRPINNRGQKDTELIGRWMTMNKYFPDKIISSPARRARQTTELINEKLNFSKMQIEFDKSLYLASFDTLMECFHIYKNNLCSLMIVAHNPGLQHLINYLLYKSVNQTSTSRTFTTSSLAIFEYENRSFDLEADKYRLKEFIQTRELD